jgi:hypothetical protein
MAGAAVQPVRESLAEHFDATGYLAMNPDVAASGMNPLAHWTASGRAEGRQPNAFFDPDFYLGQHPELGQMTEFQAWRHFMDAGMQGGWLPNEHFDAAFYAAHNPDVAGSGMSPVQHYVAVGWAEGRNPYPDFDPDAYLADHPEVVGAGYDHASALNQYLAEGQCRGAAY